VLRVLFGRRLEQLRKQRKITQERLAEAIGVSSYTIRRWEKAIDAPEFDRLEVIAEALGVEPKELFDFSDK
jgi:transcriptional regulator with XRE-family HTH domain